MDQNANLLAMLNFISQTYYNSLDVNRCILFCERSFAQISGLINLQTDDVGVDSFLVHLNALHTYTFQLFDAK